MKPASRGSVLHPPAANERDGIRAANKDCIGVGGPGFSNGPRDTHRVKDDVEKRSVTQIVVDIFVDQQHYGRPDTRPISGFTEIRFQAQ